MKKFQFELLEEDFAELAKKIEKEYLNTWAIITHCDYFGEGVFRVSGPEVLAELKRGIYLINKFLIITNIVHDAKYNNLIVNFDFVR